MRRGLNYAKNNERLYIVATPIGNLNELSPRALEVLNEVDMIACEDTRVTGVLLKHFNIKKELLSLHEHNEKMMSIRIIHLIKDENKKIAYVSDQGFPGISDPGSLLIKEVLKQEIDVIPISGPCALINALVGSGLDTSHFYFHGFLSAKNKVRREELLTLKRKEETLIFYEAPHRLKETIAEMLDVLGNRRVCLARELSKIHEEFIRGNLEEMHLLLQEENLKGEFVIVLEGANNESSIIHSDEDILRYVNSLVDVGMSTKDAIEKASEYLKIKKNYIYKLYHQG